MQFKKSVVTKFVCVLALGMSFVSSVSFAGSSEDIAMLEQMGLEPAQYSVNSDRVVSCSATMYQSLPGIYESVADRMCQTRPDDRFQECVLQLYNRDLYNEGRDVHYASLGTVVVECSRASASNKDFPKCAASLFRGAGIPFARASELCRYNSYTYEIRQCTMNMVQRNHVDGESALHQCRYNYDSNYKAQVDQAYANQQQQQQQADQDRLAQQQAAEQAKWEAEARAQAQKQKQQSSQKSNGNSGSSSGSSRGNSSGDGSLITDLPDIE